MRDFVSYRHELAVEHELFSHADVNCSMSECVCDFVTPMASLLIQRIIKELSQHSMREELPQILDGDGAVRKASR